jgi:hypothetical protein
MSYGALKNYKFPKNKNNKVVIGGWGATVWGVSKSDRIRNSSMTLDIFPQRVNTDEASETS